MKPPFDIAADLDTPVSAFRKLAPFGPRFLLESAEGGQRLGRYSFIGMGDGMTLKIDGHGLTIDGVTTPVPDTPTGLLNAFRGALAQTPTMGPEVPGVPFPGGLVGAIGYDFIRRLEPIGSGPVKGVMPPEAVMVAPRSVLIFDHLSRRVALLHEGDEAERQSLRREVIAALRGALPPRRSSGVHEAARPSFERGAFIDAVKKTKGYIHAGEVFQLVLSIRMEGRTELDPFEVYRALRLLNPSPYMYYFEHGPTAVVGSSPEALVRLNGRQATLRPIAGTRPRGVDSAQDAAFAADLLSDPKETAEHVMLVDLARNDLGRVAVPGSVTVAPYRSIEHYSHVMHTVSGVQGVLAPNKDAFDLFAATFPAGTVVGAPKVRAMQIIDELEPVPRGLYAGTVGYFGQTGDMDQAITIRTVVFHEGRYAFQAGAGIVADSVPEKEHAECHAKAAALGAALDLAEEGL